MSLRIRQVKPAFWSDAKLLKIPLETRLFYVGLWCVSDDAGWFDWEPEQVAIDLHLRESVVRKSMTVLAEIDRVRLYDCGHGEVPNLVEHQRLAGATKRVETVYRKHLNGCPAVSRHFPHTPDTVSKGNGQERNGQETRNVAGLGERLAEVTDPTTGKTTYVALASVKPS